MELPEALYYAAQSRQLDRVAIEERGIAGYELMQRAGAAAFSLLRARWPRARRVTVVCGPGNNGGDGYVIARLAAEAGLQAAVLVLGDPARLHGDALTARRAAMEHAGITGQPFNAEALQGSEVIVDAIFGTGLEREVTDEWRLAIDAINATPEAAVLAIDIPSGLHADSGRVLGVAVKAHVTISFIGLKAGLFTGRGRDYCGDIAFDNLGLPADLYDGIAPAARRISDRSLAGVLPHRRRSTHKGDVGHVAVIGGAPGMAGAACLAGEAAARTGAGLVTLVTHPTHAAYVSMVRSELLSHALAEGTALQAALRRATVIAIGPGLGQERWASSVLAGALDCRQPKVIDADALNLLAQEPQKRDDWILTPHPGEAARLLDATAAEVQAQRFDALRALLDRYGGVCVLKGAGTLIGQAGSSDIWLCDAGNPGMASGGMGDVLTGIVAALLAQRLDSFAAARLGVWLHATAADDAAKQDGEIGLLASDLLPFVRRRLNQLGAHAR